MNRKDIIQKLINKVNATTYLEIGVQGGKVFNNIFCNTKVGVDPDLKSAATLHITSDQFFAINKDKFDVIFIDGLHHSDQVLRDINNSLSILNHGGYIVCHDMSPNEEIIQRVPQQTGIWTGDCWKAWVTIRFQNPNLYMFVIDTDYGCGIIRKGNQDLITLDCELTWENLQKNRNYWLNLVSVNEFSNMKEFHDA
jgi:hypothetical protein